MTESAHGNGPEKAPKLNSLEAQEKIDSMREKLQENAEKSKSGEQHKDKLEAKASAEKLAISGKEQAPSGS